MEQGEITLYIASSLDGFIATEDGGISWLEEFEDHYEDGVSGGSYEEFFDNTDCLIMGANTYEQVFTFDDWPYKGKPTYVTTRRELPSQSEYVEFYEGEVSDLANDLKASYENIWLVGGADLAQKFLRSNSVTVIQLSIIPVLLGDGISLFGDTGSSSALHLRDVTAYETGIAELEYVVDLDNSG